jgi:hypothetical protein
MPPLLGSWMGAGNGLDQMCRRPLFNFPREELADISSGF